jgi:hypothetical protein
VILPSTPLREQLSQCGFVSGEHYMKAKELDKKFDDGEDLSQYLDISKARRPQQDQ